LNQFSHHEDGGITFRQNIKTFIHHRVPKHKWPSSDQQPLWKPENLQFITLLKFVSFCTCVRLLCIILLLVIFIFLKNWAEEFFM
jgi:hypothetical protein